MVEVWYFLARPIVGELMVWRKRLKDEAAMAAGSSAATQANDIAGAATNGSPPPATGSPPTRKTRRPIVYVAWALFLLLVIPFDFTINAQGMLKPTRSMEVIAFTPAQVVSLPPAIGTPLKEGQVIMQLRAPDIEHRIGVL